MSCSFKNGIGINKASIGGKDITQHGTMKNLPQVRSAKKRFDDIKVIKI